MILLQCALGAAIGALGVAIWAIPKIRQVQKLDEEIAQLNEDLISEQKRLKEQNGTLKQQYDSKLEEFSVLSKQIESYTADYYNQTVKAEKMKAEEAISQLREKYQAAKNVCQEEYLKTLDECGKDFSAQIQGQQLKLSQLQSQLEELDKLYTASIEARIREKEISEKQNFYCLTLDPIDVEDITILEKIKGRLNKPRILSMLIWSTYYQKPMTTLCNNILGLNIVTGIYKITNQQTQECYIGQAKDVAARWKEHAKCGLDIDRPQGNKLYKAMVDYGLQSFSWELLEKCNADQLNEREKYYIGLYKSADYGYNTLKGVNK